MRDKLTVRIPRRILMMTVHETIVYSRIVHFSEMVCCKSNVFLRFNLLLTGLHEYRSCFLSQLRLTEECRMRSGLKTVSAFDVISGRRVLLILSAP